MKTKFIITSFMFCVLNLSVLGQLDRFNSYEDLDSLARVYFKSNNVDSTILIYEYARNKFPKKDKEATYRLDFLYLRMKQDSKAIENWDYGLRKRYFFGLSPKWIPKRFKNNPDYIKLVDIDKQIGDSLNNISHVEHEVILPTNYSTEKKYSVLFVFHGNDWNMQMSKNIWTSDLIRDKFIVVFMQSYIHMSKYGYEWKLNDEKTNREFKEIYEQTIKKYPVNKNKVFFLGMSAGGWLAIDYAFNKFVPVQGLVLNCPVIPNISDSSVNKFVDENKKIAIITGENDWALKNQKNLINKVDSLEGNSKITIKAGLGHQFADDFSTLLDDYLNWIIE